MSPIRFIVALVAFLFFVFSIHSQTTLIDPSGDGGFENGAGFAANGWIIAQGSSNIWHANSNATPFAGTGHAFISNDGGTSNTYSNTTASTNHFYRDVSVPSGQSIITLNFQYRNNPGETGWDRVLVYVAPTSVTPTAGVPASNSNVLTGATLVYTGAGNVATYTATGNIIIPASFAGTTMRIIFVWQNDGGFGGPGGGAVDNISLTSSVPANFNTSTFGGLWSSPATWAGGVVPAPGNDITVVAGSTLTVDAATYSVRDITVNGIMNFAGTGTTANNLTVTRDLTVGATGTLLAHNLSVNTSAGITINLGRDMHVNGTANLGCLNLNMNGNGATGVSQTLDGTGTIYGPAGTTKGLIRALLAANVAGTVTINTAQTLVCYSAMAATGVNSFNTNGKFECNLGANFDGQAVNRQVYTIAVTNHGAGYTSAPTVTIAAPAGGTAATATANWDPVSQTVRSITIVTPGDGYFNTFNPTVTLTGGGFTTAATAVAVVPSSIVHNATIFLAQRGTQSVITGSMPSVSNDGVVSITTSNGLTTPVAAAGQGYSSAPTIGFTGPTGLNLVTAMGSGYTGAPTAISVSGATNVSGGAYELDDFTYVVQDGKLVSCVLNSTIKTYDAAPVISLTIPGGTGAAVAFPAGCWPSATANIGGPNGMITGFNVTNAGFGYRATPTVALAGGGFVTAAQAFARCGFYALNYQTYLPPGYPQVINEGAEMPASRMLFQSTFNNLFGTAINITGGDLTFIGGTPVTLTSGQINMNGSNLIFANFGYAGVTGGLLNRFTNVGYVEMNFTGTAGTTRTVPAGSGIAINNGTNTVAFTNGPTIVRYRVSRGTPSGESAIGTNAYRVECFDVMGNPGKYGLNPVVTLNWNHNDGLLTDKESLFVSQSTAFSGPWTVRSVASETGALGATGSRATATSGVGPWIPSGTGIDYFSFTSYFLPTALNFEVTRTTGITYNSIIGLAGTTHWMGASNDEGSNTTMNLTGTTFTYDGLPITTVTMHANGFIGLTGFSTTGFQWFNNIAGSKRVIAPFWDDLISPSAAPTPANGYGAHRIDGTLGSGNAVITFEWKNMETYQNPGPNLNFQVKLYEDGNKIEFVYGVMQGFDGTIASNGAYAYTYTAGMSNIAVNALDPQLGQVLAQNEENTRNFGPYGGMINNRGQNYMSSMPECYSSILFTPGTYTPYVPGSGVPINDDPANAIPITALAGPPADLCGTYYSSRGASLSAVPLPTCANPSANNADDDVWFSFQCINSTSTVKVYSSGGYNAYVQIFADATPGTLSGVVGAEVFCQNAAAEGATETINATGLTVGHYYYVRVFHRQGGIQATATATISGGAVTNITVTNPGSGYHQAAFGGASPFQYATPRVTILGGLGRNAVAQVGETGSGATATNWFTEPAPGSIASISLMNGGAGYVIPPTVKIEAPNSGTTGDFAITVFATPVPPSNDDICSAINVVPAYSCTLTAGPPSSVATATNPPAGCGGIPDDDVWLSFTAVTGFDRVEVKGNGSYNPHLQIFSSSDNTCTGTLTSIACINLTGVGGTEVFQGNGTNLTAGNTYFVRVYHTGTGAASGSYSYCITTPPCGYLAPSALNQTVTGLTNITVAWTAGPPATSYNWEIVPLGNAQGVGVITSGTAGSPIVAITGLTSDTQYTFWVNAVCPLGNSQYASLNVSTAYCASAATSPSDEDIWNVTLGTLNNSSVCTSTGYTNFTSVPAPSISQGTDYTLDVRVGSCGGSFNTCVAVFADLNQDGVLHNTNERIMQAGPFLSSTTAPGTLFSGTINIPVNCTISGNTRLRVVAVETSSPSSINACGTYSWGETEDYTINIVPPSACSGPPPVLTVSSSANPACLGSTITLSVPPIVQCGISYQWEESTGGPFTPVGTDSPTYTTTFTGATSYRCQVTCSAGPSTTQSTTLAVTVNTDQCICGSYCANPTSTFSCDEFIGNVTFNTINNNSGCSGHYQNFTSISTSITAGATYAMSVSNGGTAYASDQVTAFFDWNANGIWNEAGESYVLTNVGGTGALFQRNIEVPCTAVPGPSRLRIRMNFAAAPIPCLNQSWGEAEDYCVNVLAGTACSGTPTPGATASSLASVCSFNPFTLSINPSMTQCGLTYQWQRSTALGGPYTNIPLATTQFFTTTQSSAFYYRCEVTCTNSGQIGYSTPLQVTMSPLYTCLCPSSASFTGDEEIYNVSIANLNNTSTCATTGGPGSIPNRYSNYTGLPAPSLTRGQTHNFCVTIGTCNFSYTTAFKIFFDFNQNGVLSDPGEEAYVSSTFPSSAAGTTFNGSVLIPATATLGTTAMRVVCVETTNPASISPCGTYGWGETEDYAVNIIGAISNDDWNTPQSTPISGSAYPAGNCYSHTLVGCGESPQANPANVLACTGGADRWYSFVAQSSVYRVTCTTSAFNCVLEMTDANGVFIDAENTVATVGGENMVTGGLSVGNTYKVAVRTYDGAVGPYNVCVQAVMASTCDDGPGTYALCTNFKPDWTGANTYTFNFAPTAPTPGVPTSATHPSQVSLSLAALSLRYGGTYDVTIDGNFQFYHADGSPDFTTVPGTVVCPITIIPQPNVQVKLEQRCTYPATLLKSSIITGKPFVCGALNYTVSAQQYSACTGGTPIGLPITGTTPGASPTINLTQVNVGGTIQGGGKWYEITWTPNMVYGAGVPTVSPVRIYVGGPVMEEEITGPAVEEKTEDVVLEANLYPNPNNGDMVNLNIANVESDDVYVKITDMNGRIVYENRYVVEGSLSTIVTFANPLAGGMYNVQFIMNDEIITRQMVVQK